MQTKVNSIQKSLAKLRTSRLPSLHHRSSRRRGNDINHATAPAEPPAASLLGLPAELRILIYEHVAEQTTLILPAVKARKRVPNHPSFLLVCKQVRREYHKILLSKAKIAVQVIRLDFENFLRVLDILPEADQAALHSNPHITVVLFLSWTPTPTTQGALLRWLLYAYRRPAGQRVPVRYDISFAKRPPPTLEACEDNMHQHIRLDILERYIVVFAKTTKEPLLLGYGMPELDVIIRDLRHCMKRMQDQAQALQDTEDEGPTSEDAIPSSSHT